MEISTLNATSEVTDRVALADSSYGLAKNWENLSPEQRLTAIGQIGFWGGMMGAGRMRAQGQQAQMQRSEGVNLNPNPNPSPYAAGEV